MVDEERADREREQFVQGAWGVWLTRVDVGKVRSFIEYKRKVGLADYEAPLDAKTQKLMRDKAIEKAEVIVRLAQGNK